MYIAFCFEHNTRAEVHTHTCSLAPPRYLQSALAWSKHRTLLYWIIQRKKKSELNLQAGKWFLLLVLLRFPYFMDGNIWYAISGSFYRAILQDFDWAIIRTQTGWREEPAWLYLSGWNVGIIECPHLVFSVYHGTERDVDENQIENILFIRDFELFNQECSWLWRVCCHTLSSAYIEKWACLQVDSISSRFSIFESFIIILIIA